MIPDSPRWTLAALYVLMNVLLFGAVAVSLWRDRRWERRQRRRAAAEASLRRSRSAAASAFPRLAAAQVPAPRRGSSA